MERYITHYIIPVLVVMTALLLFARSYHHGAKFKFALSVALGFLLGWASAFTSLHIFNLYK